MGLPMTTEEDFQPQAIANARRFNAWLTTKNEHGKASIAQMDETHFKRHGAFPARTTTPSMPAILRLEFYDATTAHLPSGIRGPNIDIHPTDAPSFSQLLAVIQRKNRNNIPLTRITLELDDRNGIGHRTAMELPAQSNNSTNEMYEVWWQAQFVYGRERIVIVQVKATTT